jgi:type IV pilus assembly protein PilW
MKRSRPQSGFGIIEIMVALALGVIIMLGVTEVATNNSQARAEIQRASLQIENAAYAMRVIETDLVSAGFWTEMGEQDDEVSAVDAAFPFGDDCDDPVLPVTAVPICPGLVPTPGDADDECNARVELVRALVYPIDGEDEAGTSCVEPKTGTNFLAIRRASYCTLYKADGTDNLDCADANGNFHIQVNSCFNPVDDAYPLPGINFRIDRNLNNLNYLRRRPVCSDLTAYSLPTAIDRAPIHRLLSHVYFVKSIVNADGDEVDSRLVRAELDLSDPLKTDDYVETELVDGVETMILEYGLDTSNDGQVDTFTTAPVGAQWHDVVVVRVSLVVRSLQPSTGFTDTKDYTLAGAPYTVPPDFIDHRRNVYTRTISLRNVAGRRE